MLMVTSTTVKRAWMLNGGIDDNEECVDVNGDIDDSEGSVDINGGIDDSEEGVDVKRWHR